ncbi:MAG: ABC transporter ATP-binding protein [Candidatus Omnitrophica bacterium]|nr:ABC transporter ATP-binding protein [Candidatus Omnitrophota bacterium]MDD5081005.1 ABC transporter ATP-binding protein [Candidatus Omnitrophota bacterium]
MNEKNQVMISLKNVVKTFDGRLITDDISLDIYRGEIFVVMGCSGSGKSTLLRLMNGSIQPDSGDIYIKGKNIIGMSQNELDELRKSFGMCFQYSALLDSLTVEENILLPLKEHTNMSQDIMNIIARMKLSLVGMGGFENYFPAELSGGMRKRVALARAIALDPEIIFYDEPTSGLDPVVGAATDALIKDLSDKLKITSIVITHNMQSVFKIADRVAMLYDGKLIEVGTPEEIRNSSNEYVRQFISGDSQGPINTASPGTQMDFFKKVF